MSERYTGGEGGELPSSLEQWEIETLAERALLRGSIRLADYPQDQLAAGVMPYSFVLPIDAEPFEELVQEWHRRGFETVTSAEIEYAQARVLDVDDPLLSPMVYVSASSSIYHPADQASAIIKDTVYTLPLVSNGRSRVKETYTEVQRGRYELLVGDQQGMLEMMASEIRPLTVADVELLRIVLSSE